jgi:hypothetical protein
VGVGTGAAAPIGPAGPQAHQRQARQQDAAPIDSPVMGPGQQGGVRNPNRAGDGLHIFHFLRYSTKTRNLRPTRSGRGSPRHDSASVPL